MFFLNHIYNLTLNNQKELICHEIQTKHRDYFNLSPQANEAYPRNLKDERYYTIYNFTVEIWAKHLNGGKLFLEIKFGCGICPKVDHDTLKSWMKEKSITSTGKRLKELSSEFKHYIGYKKELSCVSSFRLSEKFSWLKMFLLSF